MMSHADSTRFAPSFALVRAHFIAGIVGLCVFSGGLVKEARFIQGQFFQPALLGLVHLCVLGWLMPIAIGALHELVPFVFERRVGSERAAWGAFAMYVVGAVGFIAQMWVLRVGWLLAVAGTSVAVALWIYALNFFATILSSKAKGSLTAINIAASLVYLLAAVTLGAALAWNLCFPYLPGDHLALLRAHAHVAGLGFFGLLIMGVAYRLLEMFLLSHGASERAGFVAFVAINAALLMLIATFVLDDAHRLLVPAAVAAAIGIVAFLAQVSAIVMRRMQRKIDVALGHTATSFLYLATALWTGIGVAFLPTGSPLHDRMTLAYGLLFVPGFIGTIVIGQLYKIVPFLVWLHRFSPYVGLKKLPSASELLPERPKQLQYLLMHAGLASLAVGVMVQSAALRTAGAVAFAASAALVAGNLGFIDARRP